MSESDLERDNYRLNFMNFIGLPLEQSIVAYMYDVPDTMQDDKFYPFTGSIQRLLFKANAGYAAPFHYEGKKILCLFNMEKPWSTIPVDKKYYPDLSPLPLEGTTQLHSKNEIHRAKIELFLAQAIEQVLKQQNFFVLRLREAYRFVYQFTEELSRGEFEIYRGFVFRPMVHPNGSASIMIDPKYRLIPRQTLKELLKAGEPLALLKKQLTKRRVIDVCPVPPEECYIRRNPEKICPLNLQGFGKNCYFVGFAGYKVKDAKFPILEYHKKCPLIEDTIDPEDPVVLIRFRGKDKLYEYPPSRIRVTKEYADLLSDPRFRTQLTFMLRPEPKRRYYLSKHFARYLRRFSIKDAEKTINLELVMEFSPLGQSGYFWKEFMRFESPYLKFRDGVAIDALEGINRYGPLESSRPTEVKVALLIFGSPKNRGAALDFYEDLTLGRYPFKGLNKIFNVLTPSKEEVDIYYSLDEVKKRKHDIILVLDFEGVTHEQSKYYEIKVRLQALKYPSQIVKPRVLKASMGRESRYLNALTNIALGIYGKLGKIAWELAEPISSADYFMGIDILPVHGKNQWLTSAHVIDNRARWLGGASKKSSGDYLSGLKVALVNVFEKYIKSSGKKIVIHREGIPPMKSEGQVIAEALKDSEVEMLWVHKESYVRIYNLLRPDYKVERGVYSRISDNSGVLFTYAAPVAPHGTPIPLMIEPVQEEGLRGRLQDLAREIFILSSVNLARIPPITLKPVTTHYADRASTLEANGVEPLDVSLWFL